MELPRIVTTISSIISSSSSSSGLASTGLPVRLHISLIASRKVVIAVSASVTGAKSRVCGTPGWTYSFLKSALRLGAGRHGQPAALAACPPVPAAG